MRRELADDQWIDVRDPRKLAQWRADEIEDAQMGMVTPEIKAFMVSHPDVDLRELGEKEALQIVGPSVMPAIRQMKYTSIVHYVSAWSFGEVTREVLLELPKAVVTEIDDRIGEIIKATGGGPQVDVTLSPDPASPTQPSSD